MICRNCGFENEEGKAFCASCGASLEVAEASPFDAPQDVSSPYEVSEDYTIPAYDETQDYSTPVFEAEAYNPDGEVADSDKSKKALIFSIVGIVLSVGGCCCDFFGVGLLFSIVGLIFGILGIVKSAKAMKETKDAKAIVGLVLSIISIVCFLVSVVLFIIIGIPMILAVAAGGFAAIGDVLGGGYYYY